MEAGGCHGLPAVVEVVDVREPAEDPRHVLLVDEEPREHGHRHDGADFQMGADRPSGLHCAQRLARAAPFAEGTSCYAINDSEGLHVVLEYMENGSLVCEFRGCHSIQVPC